MTFVWSAVCALTALAAGVQQAPGVSEVSQMRTKVLPGHGYIRYEVLPGDDEVPPGDLIVVHEERQKAPPAEVTPAVLEEPAPLPARRAERACTGTRAKLVARIYEIQGMQMDPEFAEWLETNLTLGSSDARAVQLLYGEPLLISALKSDPVARSLADDLARCDRAHGFPVTLKQ